LPENINNNESGINKDFSIYSSGNIVYIENLLDNSVNADFLLINISGQKIIHENLWIDNLKSISTSINSGFYIVKVISNNGIATQKIFLR